MNFNGITVVGLVSGVHIIEDIRISVPFQVAVQIPGELVVRSTDLKQDIQDKKVLQIRGALPAGAVLRGSGAVPRSTAPSPQVPPRSAGNEKDALELRDLRTKVARLELELETSREQGRHLQALLLAKNLDQENLGQMASSLLSIQATLAGLKVQGIQVSQVPGGSQVTGVEEDVPMFIPETFRNEGAKVNIAVNEEARSSNLSETRDALRNLRKKDKG